MAQDTIFALSSGHGRAGVAIIRVSGPGAEAAMTALSGPLRPPRLAALRPVRDPDLGEAIDRGLVLWFPAGASFTGEPTGELQLHGGRAVIAATLAALGRMPGLRAAEPGEFTRRAFENGRIDLAQVEALDDLIAADTGMQRRQALRGLEGRLSALVSEWREQLLVARALLAAEIDFADEGDVGDGASAEVDSLLQRLLGEMGDVLASRQAGRIIADGFQVVIIGRPNCGKSTLLNALSGSEAAIVSEIPGTTRDVIEVRLDWDGFEIVLADTAGLRETPDPVEHIGVGRALSRASGADLCLVLDDQADWSVTEQFDSLPDSIRVRTKMDLGSSDQDMDPAVVRISALTGEGLPALKAAVLSKLGAAVSAEAGLVVRERQAAALGNARLALERALAMDVADVELRDHEVRAATASLDVLVGRIGVEEVLGAVFSRFCVGK